MSKLTDPILPGTAATDYERYLRTDELLSLQKTPSEMVHRDELLFQTIHQASELWLKLAAFEVETAVESLDRTVVLLASGGLSHRFWPLREIRDHETAALENIITPEAAAADQLLIARLEAGEHAAVLADYPELRRHAPEGMFAHYLMMVGALGGADCRARGVRYSDYESAAGTGQDLLGNGPRRAGSAAIRSDERLPHTDEEPS